MAFVSRLCTRQLGSSLLGLNARNSFVNCGVRTVTLKPIPRNTELEQMSHDDRNMKIGRPQSPHLTIYAPQLTAMLSITHRSTGAILAGYATMFGVGALFMTQPFTEYLSMIESLELSQYTLLGIKFCLAAPLGYHASNGIRHLFWDIGKFLSIKDVYLTGYAMVGLATAITLYLTTL